MRVSFAVLISTAILFAQTKPPQSFSDENNAWYRVHRLPPDASPEQRRAFDQELAEASAVWVKHWPDDPHAWLTRLRALARLKSTSNQELEEAGDTLLRVVREHPVQGFRFVPFQTEVAMVWCTRKIRLEQSLELTQEAAREDEQAQKDNPSITRQFFEVIAQGLFNTLGLEEAVAIDLKKFDVADAAIGELKQYIDEHPQVSARLRHLYLADAGALANAESHKPDALSYYLEAFREYPEDSWTEKRARELWKELGGSEKGFAASAGAMTSTLPAIKPDNSPWTAMNKALTALHVTDISGKLWTVNDLRGRKTLINVWATWCYPCQKELPAVQAIFDQWKGRKDVQLLTVSEDKDPGWVTRFAEREHYTFPIVVLNAEDVDKMVGIEGVPRTWIADSAGAVRFETIGYEPALWPKAILQQLEAVQ